MTGGTWHPYSERRPTAIERAAERYREACVAYEAAQAAYDVARVPWAAAAARGDWTANTRPVFAARDAAEATVIEAMREKMAAQDALLAAARGDL